MKNFKAEKDYNRVDQFLCEAVTSLSKNAARNLCENKLVIVNAKIVRAGDKLKTGDIIEINDQPKQLIEKVDLEILFEDQSVIVLNKKRGIPSVSIKSNPKSTVADFLASYNKIFLTASLKPTDAGLIQRLDNYTSGVILAAKNRNAWEFLKQEMKEEKIAKSYLALVEGNVAKQRQKIEAPLLIEKDQKTVKVLKEKTITENKNVFSAQSEVFLVLKFEDYSLVRVLGKKMRRHQVRAHLASIGHPLVGDKLYGSKKDLEELFPKEKGFLLHAESIAFKHPLEQKTHLIKAPSAFLWQLSKKYKFNL